jgi:hypothetical protein
MIQDPSKVQGRLKPLPGLGLWPGSRQKRLQKPRGAVAAFELRKCATEPEGALAAFGSREPVAAVSVSLSPPTAVRTPVRPSRCLKWYGQACRFTRGRSLCYRQSGDRSMQLNRGPCVRYTIGDDTGGF